MIKVDNTNDPVDVFDHMDKTGQCFQCGGPVTKTEDINGVEIGYNFVDGDWDEAERDFYGETTVKYECENCGELHE